MAGAAATSRQAGRRKVRASIVSVPLDGAAHSSVQVRSTAEAPAGLAANPVVVGGSGGGWGGGSAGGFSLTASLAETPAAFQATTR